MNAYQTVLDAAAAGRAALILTGNRHSQDANLLALKARIENSPSCGNVVIYNDNGRRLHPAQTVSRPVGRIVLTSGNMYRLRGSSFDLIAIDRIGNIGVYNTRTLFTIVSVDNWRSVIEDGKHATRIPILDLSTGETVLV